MSEYQSITADEPVEPEHQLLSLSAVVRDAVPLMRAVIADTALLRIAVDAQAPLVQASAIAMRRVLLHLVQNASRAIRQPHGVVEIGVTGMMSSDGSGPQFVRLTVADNGIGMDGEAVVDLRQHLTEAPPASHGAGRGLRFVHREVSAHGGRLQLDTEPGNGTTVRIDLPAASPRPAARGVPQYEGDNRHPARRRPI